MITDRFRTLFGGPSQPEPTDPRGGIQKAKTLAEENDNVVNPNQYENPAVRDHGTMNLESEDN